MSMLLLLSSTTAAGAYTTADAVRTALGLDSTALPDGAAVLLITDAEDMIDSMLGPWWPDETTGRKIVEARVMPWQWLLLGRATVKMAVLIYRNPSLLTDRQYDRVKGPDFELEHASGSAVGSSIVALLDQSGLRMLTGRAVVGRRYGNMRPDYARFLAATRHDGT